MSTKLTDTVLDATPSPGDSFNKLADTAFVAAALAGLATQTNSNGSWIEFPDGLLLQWGTAPSSSSASKTFPVPFTVGAVVTVTTANGQGNIISVVGAIFLNHFTYGVNGCVFIGGSGTGPTGAEIMQWIAIGK